MSRRYFQVAVDEAEVAEHFFRDGRQVLVFVDDKRSLFVLNEQYFHDVSEVGE